MKKNFIRLMSLLLVVAMMAAMPVVSFAAAKDHVHEFNAGQSVDPTCTNRGYTRYTCKTEGCGYYYDAEFVPSLHEWEYPLVETKDGYDIHKCSKCSDTYKVKHFVAPDTCNNHNPQQKTIVRASCGSLVEPNESGAVTEYSYTYCASCGEYTFSTSNTVNVSHTWSEWKQSVAPTVSAEGVQYRTCDTCGRVETKAVDMVDNTLRPGKTSRVTPVYNKYTADKTLVGYLPVDATIAVHTVTTDGKFIRIYNGFNWSLSSPEYWIPSDGVSIGKFGASDEYTKMQTCLHIAYHDVYHKDADCENPEMRTSVCNSCGAHYMFSTSGSAIGHKDSKGNVWNNDYLGSSWKIENDSAWVLVKAPTATANGEMKRTCSVCGYVESNTTAPLMQPHDYAHGYVHDSAVITGADMVKIYDKTANDRELIGYATKGCTVTVTEYSMDKTWCKIGSGSGKDWWVKTSDVTINGTVGAASAYNGAIWFGTVKSGLNLDVRASAGQTGSVSSSVKSGSTVAIYEVDSTGKWGKISSTEAKWVYNGVAIGTAGGYMDLKPVLVKGYVAPTQKLENYIIKSHVTSSIGVNVRKDASVQSDKLANLPKDGTTVYIYETKEVDGVIWGQVRRVLDANGNPVAGCTWGKEVTKAALAVPNAKQEKAWIAMNYVAIDEGKLSSEIAAATPAPAPVDSVVATGIVTSNSNLKVRSTPEISLVNLMGSLPTGTKCEFYHIGDANGASWGRIKFNGEEAWVCMQYIQITSSTAASNSSAAAVANAAVANCSTAVNVRSNADISGNLIGTIPLNTRIAVVELNNGWGRVSGKGWVYLDYVRFDAGAYDALMNPPKNEAPAAPAEPVDSDEVALSTYTNVVIPAKVTEQTRVYEKPDATSKVVMDIYSGTTFSIVNRTIINDKLWYKVSQGSVSGWMVDKTDYYGGLFGLLKFSTLVIPQKITGTISSTRVNVYEKPNIDSNVLAILGKGSSFEIPAGSEHHYTEGVYAWAELSTGGWIMLHAVAQETAANTTLNPDYNALPAISGAVIMDNVTLYKDHDTSSSKLVDLMDGTNVTFTDWYYDSTTKTNWGKVTQGEFTGWVQMTDANIEQIAIAGTVTADAVNLYSACGTSDNIQLVLRKGERVTVTERRLVGNAVWGRMVAAKDTQKRELWGNLAGITLDGQTVQQPATSTPSTSTPSTSTPSTSTPSTSTPVITVTAGVVANTDKLNVRTVAGASNPLATTLARGTKVSVYEQKTVDGAQWGRIDQGWVAMMYIDLSTMGSTTGNTVASGSYGGQVIMTTVPTGAAAVGFTNIDNLAVRSGAGLGYGKVSTLPNNTNVVVYEQVLKDGMIWGRIDQGWICTSYVTFTAAGSTGTGTQGTIARCFYTANVRNNPGVGNALVGKIMVNSRVEIYEQKEYSGEMWGRTSLGWVAMQYVLTDAIPVI